MAAWMSAPVQAVVVAYCCAVHCSLVALGYYLCLFSIAVWPWCRYDRTADTKYGRTSNILISLFMCVATFFNGLYAMTAVSRLVRPVSAPGISRD